MIVFCFLVDFLHGLFRDIISITAGYNNNNNTTIIQENIRYDYGNFFHSLLSDFSTFVLSSIKS